jgi:hypothetical protein
MDHGNYKDEEEPYIFERNIVKVYPDGTCVLNGGDLDI